MSVVLKVGDEVVNEEDYFMLNDCWQVSMETDEEGECADGVIIGGGGLPENDSMRSMDRTLHDRFQS